MSAEPAPQVTRIGTLIRESRWHRRPRGERFLSLSMVTVTPAQPAPEKTYFEVLASGPLAHRVAESLHKGDGAIVVGVERVEHWVANDGSPRSTIRVYASNIGAELRWRAVEVIWPRQATG